MASNDRIGLGMRLELPEWNRRAMVALRGVNFGFGVGRSADIVGACRYNLEHDRPLSEKQQQALFSIVHAHRRQITDQAVLDLAAERAKGAD